MRLLDPIDDVSFIGTGLACFQESPDSTPEMLPVVTKAPAGTLLIVDRETANGHSPIGEEGQLPLAHVRHGGEPTVAYDLEEFGKIAQGVEKRALTAGKTLLAAAMCEIWLESLHNVELSELLQAGLVRRDATIEQIHEQTCCELSTHTTGRR